MSNRQISNKSLNYIKTNIDNICDNIPPGQTELLFNRNSAEHIRDAYQAVDVTVGGWKFMKEESPPNHKGYTFWDNEILKVIEVRMKYINEHTRASFGSTMKDIQYIAIYGWKSFIRRRIEYLLDHDEKDKNKYLNNILNLMGKNEPLLENNSESIVNNVDNIIEEVSIVLEENPEGNQLEVMADVFENTSIVSDRQQQADALRQFNRGKMDYATMRTFCG